MKKLRQFVESNLFQNFVLIIILLNCILMGVMTSTTVMASSAGNVLIICDKICFYIFVVELVLKIIAYNKFFYKDGWNIFDAIIVITSFLADFAALSAFRVFRVFKAFRSLKSLKSIKSLKALKSLRGLKFLSGLKQLQIIVSALMKSIPSIGWTAFLLIIISYVYGLMGISLFGENYPDLFGNLGRTALTLFELITMEGWTSDICHPLMESYSWAWLFVISFIIIADFLIMNVVVGIVVNTYDQVSIASRREDEAMETDEKSIKEQILLIERNLEVLKSMLKEKDE